MRPIACLPVGFLGLVLAASHCGGASFGSIDADASADDGGGSGNAGGSGNGGGSGHAGSGGSGTVSGTATGASTGSGSGNGGSGSNSGAGTGNSTGSSTGSSGSGSSGSPVDAGHADAGDEGGTQDSGPHPCSSVNGCGMGQSCCGSTCCTPGQLCCVIGGPVPPVDPYYCLTPTASQPMCPPSCSPKCVSDRNLKRDVEPVDDHAVLESVARMPVSTWSYKSEDPSVRHLGPMAQDFHAAFGLGDTDRAYDSIDAHGVAFAAIKGLYEEVQEQSARIERLERENESLRERQCTSQTRSER
jgi:hypothetical protein